MHVRVTCIYFYFLFKVKLRDINLFSQKKSFHNFIKLTGFFLNWKLKFTFNYSTEIQNIYDSKFNIYSTLWHRPIYIHALYWYAELTMSLYLWETYCSPACRSCICIQLQVWRVNYQLSTLSVGIKWHVYLAWQMASR